MKLTKKITIVKNDLSQCIKLKKCIHPCLQENNFCQQRTIETRQKNFLRLVFSIASDGVGLAIVTTVVFSAISLLRIKHWSRNRNYKRDRTEEKINGLFTGTYGTQGRPANRLGRELAQPCI